MTEEVKSAEQIELEIGRTRAEIDGTLTALRRKLSPGQLLDHALGYAREGGGEFAANIGRTARDNPIPLTLLGIGLGWLMISGSRSSEPAARGRAGTAGDDVSGTTAELGRSYSGQRPATYPRDPRGTAGGGPALPAKSEATGSSVGSSAQRVREGVGDAAGSARSKAESLQEAAADRAHRAAEEASRMSRGLSERTSQLQEGARERARDTRAKAQTLVEGAQDRGARVVRRAGTFVHDYPLAVGLLGLSVGAAIAAALPITRREDELLGEKGDAARQAARHAAHEGAEQAKRAAQAAYEEGTDEAKKRGLTPEGAKEEAGRIVQAGADVAKAAARAAESETRKPGGAQSEGKAVEGRGEPGSASGADKGRPPSSKERSS